ncbi:hypothetical protein KY311_02685 [Candidatus Woesearchaeota archaeon]|nr:hypothetical protein [Candidatus Woesearchaeota archaeon]
MKGLLLISTGLDSPVAGYIMKKKHVDVAGVHFSVGDKGNRIVMKLLRKIGVEKLYIVPVLEMQKEYASKCNTRYQCIFCKRMMYRIAEAIAQRDGFDFLLTGESMGQVASQTLDNMALLDSTVKIRVLRPLLCYDKVETIRIAKKIDTYNASTEGNLGCAFVPSRPVTKAAKEAMETEEAKLNIQDLMDKALETTELVKL